MDFSKMENMDDIVLIVNSNGKLVKSMSRFTFLSNLDDNDFKSAIEECEYSISICKRVNVDGVEYPSDANKVVVSKIECALNILLYNEPWNDNITGIDAIHKYIGCDFIRMVTVNKLLSYILYKGAVNRVFTLSYSSINDAIIDLDMLYNLLVNQASVVLEKILIGCESFLIEGCDLYAGYENYLCCVKGTT